MAKVKIKDHLIEQLRDTFNGRYTYDNTEQWIDNVSVCIEEICQETNMMTMQMEYEKKAKEVV